MAEVRRVRRIIRKIDAWTVFKVSSIFWAVAALGLVLGLIMFWSVLKASGIPERIADFLVTITLVDEGSDPFGDDDAFFRLALFGSIAWAILGCGLTTLSAVMYNLISDVVGGVEIVVLEETLQPTLTPPAPSQGGYNTTSDITELPTQENPVTNRR
ncbi:MAG TPA: DUF3566 domain-containing protein [Acidimicrobiia bacterium]|jgi:hypothetical protein